MTAEKAHYPQLTQSMETDILIIGGGITGISCAYCLSQQGAQPLLIEAEDLCGGTTGNTTGKLTIQHGIIYGNILEKHGMDFAGQYAQSQTTALDFVRKQVKEAAIDCQLMDNTANLYASTLGDRTALEKEYAAYERLNIPAEYIKTSDFPNDNFGMLALPNQAVFHPVRYATSLAARAVKNGAKIYTFSKALRIEAGDINTVYCENDLVIKARHLIMATQYPIYDGPNLFYTRLYAKRAYAIAIRPKGVWPEGSYINVNGPVRSVRSHMENGERILIVAGENHATGRGEADMELHYDRLTSFAERISGSHELLAKWSAQDYETPDQIPYIGKVSANSNIYIAAGFGKWGLSNGTLAGIMLSQLILSGSCPYQDLYSRNRADYTSAPGKTVKEVFSSVTELIKSKLESPESLKGLQPGEGRIIRFEGKVAGIYRDFQDNVTILDVSCTHMSTELNFNSAEATWDCPAHGGRFNTDGDLLEGPPKDSLQVYFKGHFSDI